MASITYLASTVLMGLVLFALIAVVAWGRDWRRVGDAEPTPRTIGRVLGGPTTWTVLFALVALGAAAGAVAVVGGAGVDIPGETVVAGLVAALGLLVAIYLFAGVYASARSRGLGRAPAVGLGSVVLGLLFLGLIVLQLLGVTGG